jgi:hypothetical protein
MFSLEMNVQEISQTSGVDCWDENLVVYGFVCVFVVWDLVDPGSPFILLNAPVVVIYETSFGELYLREGSEDT